MSRHEGRLKGKGILGKKSNMHIPESEIRKANFTVLQNSSLVAPYMDEHMNIVWSKNRGESEDWITHHHIDSFDAWLRQKLMGDSLIGDQLQWLTGGPSMTISGGATTSFWGPPTPAKFR